MTYKQFMKEFEEYKKMRVEVALNKYENYQQAAKALGTSASSISRLVTGNSKINNKLVSKIIGEDIEEIDITGDAAKQFQIQLLEQKIKELKGEQ